MTTKAEFRKNLNVRHRRPWLTAGLMMGILAVVIACLAGVLGWAIAFVLGMIAFIVMVGLSPDETTDADEIDGITSVSATI